jgi:hypothetical protein
MANEDWREKYLHSERARLSSERARINTNRQVGRVLALGMILSGGFSGLLGFAIGAVTFRPKKPELKPEA